MAAAILGGLGVVIGAFGAHGMPTFLENQGHAPELIQKRLDQFDVGARYHLVHAVTLLALGCVTWGSDRIRGWVYRLMVMGIFLFSGSLYLLVLTNQPRLGAVTPLGGLSWIIAWTLLIFFAKSSSER